MSEEKVTTVIKAFEVVSREENYFYSFIVMLSTNTNSRKSDDKLRHLLGDGDCKKETMD